jgi:predicted branched-subunit amino acid permease
MTAPRLARRLTRLDAAGEPVVTITATVTLAVGIGLLMVGVATVETLLFSRLPFAGGERFALVSAPARVLSWISIAMGSRVASWTMPCTS